MREGDLRLVHRVLILVLLAEGLVGSGLAAERLDLTAVLYLVQGLAFLGPHLVRAQVGRLLRHQHLARTAENRV